MITHADQRQAAQFVRSKAGFLARQFLPAGFWTFVVQIVIQIVRAWLERDDAAPALMRSVDATEVDGRTPAEITATFGRDSRRPQ